MDPVVVVGVDEAGAGPVFGSLWAAALSLPDGYDTTGIGDSKRMTHTRRMDVRRRLLEDGSDASYGLGEVTQAEIDAMGLGEARVLVFERALDNFVERSGMTPTKVLVDGILFRPWRRVPYECHPKAEDVFPCVGGASILAKTSRDLQVLAWCDEDPTLDARYGLRSNKGYLSRAHIKGIKEHGYSPLHRRSFRIRELQN